MPMSSPQMIRMFGWSDMGPPLGVRDPAGRGPDPRTASHVAASDGIIRVG